MRAASRVSKRPRKVWQASGSESHGLVNALPVIQRAFAPCRSGVECQQRAGVTVQIAPATRPTGPRLRDASPSGKMRRVGACPRMAGRGDHVRGETVASHTAVAFSLATHGATDAR